MEDNSNKQQVTNDSGENLTKKQIHDYLLTYSALTTLAEVQIYSHMLSMIPSPEKRKQAVADFTTATHAIKSPEQRSQCLFDILDKHMVPPSFDLGNEVKQPQTAEQKQAAASLRLTRKEALNNIKDFLKKETLLPAFAINFMARMLLWMPARQRRFMAKSMMASDLMYVKAQRKTENLGQKFMKLVDKVTQKLNMLVAKVGDKAARFKAEVDNSISNYPALDKRSKLVKGNQVAELLSTIDNRMQNFFTQLNDRMEKLEQASLSKDMPKGIKDENIIIAQNPKDGKYYIAANLGDKGKTDLREISYSDYMSYKYQGTVSATDLAAKYITKDINNIMNAASKPQQQAQQEVHQMKI